MTPGLDIIHRDDMIVVVNKRSGMLAVPGRGPLNQVSVVHYLRELVPDCIEQPSVHRLDMDTSGLMVLTLTAEGHRHLSNQFQVRSVEKTYEALLAGDVSGDEGMIELSFRLDPDRRPYQIFDPVQGKIGVTRWRVLVRTPGFTRVEFLPLTGRTHQLRIHSAHPLGLNCPIVGDRLYGSGTLPGELKLHARRLVFDHPGNGTRLAFECTPPF
ncbi:MAG: RluA family pseudouridine synthase [Candidatus Ozemobacteraceae bacterium]